MPLSTIHTWQESVCTTIGAGSETIARTYVDGLGRPRGTVMRTEYADTSTADWQHSGVVQFTSRGTVYAAYDSEYLDVTDPTEAEAVALPTALASEQEYDAFGRPTRSRAQDGVVVQENRYHALSLEVPVPAGPP